MATPIGLVVQQVPSQAPPLIAPSDVGVLGLVLRSRRGTTDEPVRFTSYQDLLNYILIDPDTPTSLTLRNLFIEAGTFGLTVYVQRVGSGSVGNYAYSSSIGLVLEILPSVTSVSGYDHVRLQITAPSPTTYDVTIKVEDSTNTALQTETFTGLTKETFADAINFGPAASKYVRVINYSRSAISTPINAVFNTVSAPWMLNTLAAVQNVTFWAGRLGKQDFGSWSQDYYVTLDMLDTTKPHLATLTVYKFNSSNSTYDAVETIGNLEISNWVSKINNSSNYIVVDGAVDGDNIPYIPVRQQLVGGSETPVALSDYSSVLAKFINTPVTEIMAPDLYSADWCIELDNFIKSQRPDIVGLCNLPYNATINNVQNTVFTAADTNLMNDTVTFGSLLQREFRVALYKGWGLTQNTIGSQTWVPTLGSIYGAYYIRKVNLNGGLPSIAPAGSTVNITTILRLDDTNGRYNSNDLTYLVRTLGVNPVVNEPGLGFYVKTSRTPSTKNEFYDVHRQRSVGFLIRSFKTSLTFIEQQPHTLELRRQVVATLSIFLRSLYDRGMFDNTKGPAGAYLIKCDDQNNPPILMEQRILVCEVAVKIVDTVETAFINIRSESRNLTVTGS